MKIAGIISEYNPFHNGHKYHALKTKEEFGATHIVAVMSGNYTQRGDLAIIDKQKRVKTALENGVDLVLELPVQFALSSAETFSRGAVSILDKLNCVDMLSFGSECGDIDLLKETAGAVEYTIESDEFHFQIRRGKNFPLALRTAMEEFYHDIIIETLDCPNNTLAIEYIKALDNIGSKISPVTIKRYCAEHDEIKADPYDIENGSCGILSASQIRKMYYSGEEFADFLPKSDFSNTADIKRLEVAILAKLRGVDKNEFAKYSSVLGGMGGRLYKAVRIAGSLGELYGLTKTKRYTLASIRRAVLCCFLGIKSTDVSTTPAFIRILGMNKKGRQILEKAECEVPINTSLKALSLSSRQAMSEARLTEFSGDMYALALEKPLPCGKEYVQKPILVK